MICLRPVKEEDAPLIAMHRERMFLEAQWPADTIASVRAAFQDWLPAKLADGSYFGFIAESEGRAVGGIGLMLLEWPPHPLHPASEKRGYILNIYVAPEFRGSGIAKALMAGGEEEFRRRGVAMAVLHATAMGKPVYQALGWQPSSEMLKHLSDEQPAL